MLPPERALEEQQAHKEGEWRALQDAARLEWLQGQLRQLQEDFVYNLQLLEERDMELKRYDAAFAQAQRVEEARQAEASELKIEVAKLRRALALEAQRVQELQQQHEWTLQEHRLELEHLHSDKNEDMDHLREQYTKLQWELQRKLHELDGQLVLQRQELQLDFESEMRRREHECRLQADAMSSAVLTQELKVKLLKRELAALKEAGAEAAESLKRAETANEQLQQEVMHRDQELKDLAAVKDARIKDLESKLRCAQLAWTKEREAVRRKHKELERLAQERDVVLASVKEAHVEQLQALEARALEMQAHSEGLEKRLCQAEWAQAEAARDHNVVVDRLREELSALQSAWDAQVAELSKEAVSKDLQAHTLQEEAVNLRAQSAQLQQDIDRYKLQLAAAVGREQSLQRDKVQLALDWQCRLDTAERDQYRRSEDLIQALAEAREQVAARLQQAEQRLCDKEEVLKALTLERDQAVRTLRTHGLVPEREEQTLVGPGEDDVSRGSPSSETQRLREQNASLRSAVAQMRWDMEALSRHVLPSACPGGESSHGTQPDASAVVDPAAPDYVLALEAEIQNLKHKFKKLEEQLADGSGPPKVSSSSTGVQFPVGAVGESPVSQGDPLQAEVTPSVLACRKMLGRVHLLDCLVSRLQEKLLQKPPEMDTIWFRLSREVDQVHVEVLELGKQVTELEKHLTTAQKEGEVVCEGQPRAPENSTLGEQVEDRTPPSPRVAEGPLLSMSVTGPAGGEHTGTRVLAPQPTPHPAELQLRRQLRAAAQNILRLQREKEQLVETGNRLRAWLRHQIGVLVQSSEHSDVDSGVDDSICHSRNLALCQACHYGPLSPCVLILDTVLVRPVASCGQPSLWLLVVLRGARGLSHVHSVISVTARSTSGTQSGPSKGVRGCGEHGSPPGPQSLLQGQLRAASHLMALPRTPNPQLSEALTGMFCGCFGVCVSVCQSHVFVEFLPLLWDQCGSSASFYVDTRFAFLLAPYPERTHSLAEPRGHYLTLPVPLPWRPGAQLRILAHLWIVACPWDRPGRQKENLCPQAPQAQELQEQTGSHTQSSWSAASSSLQDTWKVGDCFAVGGQGLVLRGELCTFSAAPAGAGKEPAIWLREVSSSSRDLLGALPACTPGVCLYSAPALGSGSYAPLKRTTFPNALKQDSAGHQSAGLGPSPPSHGTSSCSSLEPGVRPVPLLSLGNTPMSPVTTVTGGSYPTGLPGDSLEPPCLGTRPPRQDLDGALASSQSVLRI
ncbi:PREDICTED: coiled-coil domain-containing protein 57 [Elephantulus edwardii]|uniref:coiled-coil domain-containing protein 57 n=1 Tax=Elephantulus edwardii TaxID=28737 RepID=UPI0003F08D5A|nr:PREDICTED: coiled-coil domain-containing protein 57 [Elephantulus edwardii]